MGKGEGCEEDKMYPSRSLAIAIVGGVGWVAGIAVDLEEHRWKVLAMALASHAAAEIIGGALG